MSEESLFNTVKIIFTEYGIPQKIMSHVGTNFMLDRFQQFSINMEQAVSSAYHPQSNRQVKACSKFIKFTFKNALIQAGT